MCTGIVFDVFLQAVCERIFHGTDDVFRYRLSCFPLLEAMVAYNGDDGEESRTADSRPYCDRYDLCVALFFNP